MSSVSLTGISMALLGLLALFAGEVTAADLPEHVNNPFAGADMYVSPDYAREVSLSIRDAGSKALAEKMRSIQGLPTAIWLDRIESIAGGPKNNNRLGLREHLLAALEQRREGVPLVVVLVLYNLPNRDCAALSSHGTLDYRAGGLDRYKHEFIDVIAGILGDPRFASLRVVIVLEPDSLPNMVTNLWHPVCRMVNRHRVYEQGIRYAIERLAELANVYLYLDIAHAGWLGWDESMRKAARYYAQVLRGIGPWAINRIDGFATNVAGFVPVEEVWLPDPDMQVGGKPVRAAGFYAWNPRFDERDYIESLYPVLVSAGFPSSIRFIVDSSRNGWGGPERPSAAPRKTLDVDAYVDRARLDRRFHRGNWCNPTGAGLGPRPRTEPFGPGHPIAAFFWIKPPGESDGTSDARQTQPDAEGKRYDPMCDPAYIVRHGPHPSLKPTGAMANAPAAGHWFREQFEMLVEHAYPPVRRSQ